MLPARIRRTILISVALLGLATTSVAAQSPVAGDTPDPHITDGSAQHALDKARTSWKKAEIRNYNVRVALTCFCPSSVRQPQTLKVRNAAPVKTPANLTAVATIGRMFNVVENAIHQKVASLVVSYGTHGVPRSIAIDVSHQIADEERSYKIDHFTRVR